jgi:putative sigma-54 modulation protein
MELLITGKNMELTATLRQLIERKLGKLSRRLPNIKEQKVEIYQEKTKSPEQHFVVEITLDINGTLLRGVERGEDLPKAVNKVAAVMDRQIERYKGKLYKKGRGSSLVRGEVSEAAQPPGEVVKVKRFVVKTVSVAEAIDQMEFLGHDFFLFFNAASEELNLLYRRRDGNYGLIEPELG